MKQVFTLLFVAFATVSIAQVDGNSGVTRDNHTNGIERIDYQANVDAYAVNDQLILVSSLQSPFEEVLVFNVQGKLMTSKVATSTREVVNTQGYSPGIYFVQARIEDEVVVKKVFISGR